MSKNPRKRILNGLGEINLISGTFIIVTIQISFHGVHGFSLSFGKFSVQLYARIFCMVIVCSDLGWCMPFQ